LTATRRWRLIRILTGQLVDLRLRWIDRQTHEAITWLRRREQAKSALLTLGGEERRIIDECARRLVASSHLDDPKDIELYRDEEVRAMTLHGATVPAPVVHWRRTVRRRCESTAPLPEMFVGAPDREPMPQVDLSAAIHGWPASPGWVAGPARVVHDIAAADALREGEILVTEATDPSWTSVMARASGIVLETGGPLSHGAIVARELGIPAVLCVIRASSVIVTGDWIEIDGYAGIIHRRGEGDEAA
jgi:pyruvate,water dikinase